MAGTLDGIRVIDFGQWPAGPLAALLLADQGVEVIVGTRISSERCRITPVASAR